MTRTNLLMTTVIAFLGTQQAMAQMPRYMMPPAAPQPQKSAPPMPQPTPVTAAPSDTKPPFMEGTAGARPIDKWMMTAPISAAAASATAENRNPSIEGAPKSLNLAEESMWHMRLNAWRLMPPTNRLSYLRDQQPGVRWELFSRMSPEEQKEIASLDLQKHINVPTHAVLYLQLAHDKFVNPREIEKRTVAHAKKQGLHKASASFLGNEHRAVEDLRPTRF